MKKIILILFMLISINIFAIDIMNEKKQIVKYEDVIKNTKAAVVNYVALWCPHCREDLKVLDEFKSKKKNVKSILIFTDANMKSAGYNNGIDDVIKYIKEQNFKNFEIYYDMNNEIIKKYSLKSVPVQTIVIDGKQIKNYEDVYTIEDLLYVFRKYK